MQARISAWAPRLRKPGNCRRRSPATFRRLSLTRTMQAPSTISATHSLRRDADGAVGCLIQGHELNPRDTGSHNNLGTHTRHRGGSTRRCAAIAWPSISSQRSRPSMTGSMLACPPPEVISRPRSHFSHKPDHAIAHANLGIALLARGQMATGWAESSWRWKTPQMNKDLRNFLQPRWHGEPAENRTLLIHAEQGFGDTLHFCRYGTLAADAACVWSWRFSDRWSSCFAAYQVSIWWWRGAMNCLHSISTVRCSACR